MGCESRASGAGSANKHDARRVLLLLLSFRKSSFQHKSREANNHNIINSKILDVNMMARVELVVQYATCIAPRVGS